MNPKVRILAYTYIAICGGALAVGSFLCLGLLFAVQKDGGRALVTIGFPFLLVSAVYFIPGLLGGIGLLRGRPWGRIIITVLSVLVLAGIPVGTLFGGWGLWVLHRAPPAPPNDKSTADHATPAGKARRPASPLPPLSAEQRSRYGGLLLVAAGVASAFVVAIGTGYRLTNDPSSPVSDTFYYAAIIVLAVTIGVGVRYWWRAPRRPRPGLARWFGADRRRLAAERREFEAERDRRLARLSADPVGRRYVERIEGGDPWSDAQIDYNEDPNRLATCLHLQPIEQAMRRAGIDVRLVIGSNVRADCCVDPVALGQRFVLPPSVEYAELPMYDRSLVDPPVAVVRCTACRSMIDVVHERRARVVTPWFPAT